MQRKGFIVADIWVDVKRLSNEREAMGTAGKDVVDYSS